MKSRIEAYTVDVGQVGALTYAPGDTAWHSINTTDLYDQTAIDAVKLTEGAYSTIMIDATEAAGDIFIALRAATGVVLTANRIRIKAGSVWERGVRGVRGAGAEGLEVISIALATGTDTIYITADVDLPQR